MEPKTKQYLLITVVGVTLFVALLRLSSVLAFAAQLVDLVLPILAGGKVLSTNDCQLTLTLVTERRTGHSKEM